MVVHALDFLLKGSEFGVQLGTDSFGNACTVHVYVCHSFCRCEWVSLYAGAINICPLGYDHGKDGVPETCGVTVLNTLQKLRSHSHYF